MSRHTELADEKHMKRGVQRARDLEGDRHAPARQRQDDHVGTVAKLVEEPGQHPAPFTSIGKGGIHGGTDDASASGGVGLDLFRRISGGRRLGVGGRQCELHLELLDVDLSSDVRLPRFRRGPPRCRIQATCQANRAYSTLSRQRSCLHICRTLTHVASKENWAAAAR